MLLPKGTTCAVRECALDQVCIDSERARTDGALACVPRRNLGGARCAWIGLSITLVMAML